MGPIRNNAPGRVEEKVRPDESLPSEREYEAGLIGQAAYQRRGVKLLRR
jgi:hypothetical protein